jgi:hypothetical protein
MPIKHAFVSSQPQSGNPAVVSTSQWNDDHDIDSVDIVGGTVGSDIPPLTISQTWNGIGTAFNCIKVDITNTASADGTLLADLKVDGVSKFSVSKDGLAVADYLHWDGQLRVTSDFSKTSSTALSDVTGLSITLLSGHTYTFEGRLMMTCAAAGGVKVGVAGTISLTDFILDGFLADDAGVLKALRASTLTYFSSSAVTGTEPLAVFFGTMTVATGGTFKVQFAQAASNGTASVIKRGSSLTIHDIT